MEKANIAVIGMGVMGANLARNFARIPGNRVAIYNRSGERTDEVIEEFPDANFTPAYTYEELAEVLDVPRTAVIMVPAGGPTDAVIDSLTEVFKPGDIIIDGGNSLYTDTVRREKKVTEDGIEYVGVGISGGEEGALTGPSIMPGGSAEAWVTLQPLLEPIAAVADDGEPCVTHVGTGGSGHFVKMVHNGIEYADMQLIAEAFVMLRAGTDKTPAEIADVFAKWNETELDSYLIEITAEVLRQVDEDSGEPLVDVILDQAGAKGTGLWTTEAALNLGVPASAIAEAVFARSLSAQVEEREAAAGLPGETEGLFVEDAEVFEEMVRQSLYAAKIVAYSQGFDIIQTAAQDFGWTIDLSSLAKIWRAGCIIRAQFLDRIAEAYEENPNLEVLMADGYFTEALAKALPSWRSFVARAAQAGVPTPVFASSLAYYDGLRTKRSSAAIIQGQRDFFGSHTYKKVTEEGTFHTLWSGDRSEVKMD